MFLRRAATAAHRSSIGRRHLLQCRHFSISTAKRAEIEITIDGKKVLVEQGAALIQACEKAGVQIPRYYNHITERPVDQIDIVITIN
jgi:NADH dehydrogenase (ubiquinone) Fe-S protein 1